MLQLSSGPRQHVAALLPETDSACVGCFIWQPRKKGRQERQKSTVFFLKSFFSSFCFMFPTVLGQGMRLCRICYLKQLLKSKTNFRNIWKKTWARWIWKAKSGSPLLFSIKQIKGRGQSTCSAVQVWCAQHSPSTTQIPTVSQYKQELLESNLKCSFHVFSDESRVLRGTTSPRVLGVSLRHVFPTPQHTTAVASAAGAEPPANSPPPAAVLILCTDPVTYGEA